MRLASIVSVSCVALCLVNGAGAAITQSERDALIALYYSTEGDSWFNSDGWLGPPGTECTWWGVTCDSTNSHVVAVDLDSNNLFGTLPSELGDLRSVRELWLGYEDFDSPHNDLMGEIPPELGQLTELEVLSLWGNMLTGSIPGELAGLVNLTYIDLDENQLTGPIPAWLGDLSMLETVWMSVNEFSGPVPTQLGELENLVTLSLRGNLLEGTIPPALGGLSNLDYLSLGENYLTGTIPVELGQLSNLEILYLSQNALSGTIPPWLGDLSSLTRLSLSANEFIGTIPSELGNLSDLETLSASRNNLSGTIPYQLGSPADLRQISLYDNLLTGTIPSELGNLGALERLYLSRNALNGTIPGQLGNLSDLEKLTLYENRLEGTIPPELGDLTNLVNLWLSGNRLTGSIPGTLAQLVSLEDMRGLDLRYNGLYTTDAALQVFLAGKQIYDDWESSQTVAPSAITVGAVGQSTVEISWIPIVYTWDSGWYRVLGSTSSGGPYQLLGVTDNKLDSGLTVTGLAPATTYHFVVQAVTEAHGWNQNTVESEPSQQVSATTRGPDACELTCTAAVPATAAVGEGVSFSATASASNCTENPAFAWTFGDGHTSTQQRPTHAYSSQGTYSWSVTASADDQVCTRTGPVTVFVQGAECGNLLCEPGETAWTCAADCGLGAEETGRSGESSTRSAVPAAVGGQGGVGGTYWVSEAMLHNPGSGPATYSIVFTPDNDPGATLDSGSWTLQAGAARFFENLVHELFGVTDNGCVRVTSDEPLMLVSRTFNDQPQGSYGQFLGAVSTSRALGVGDRAFLPGLSEDSAFRSNVILQEVAGLDTDVRLSVFRRDGSAVGNMTLSVPAFTKRQERLLNLGFTGLSAAYAKVEVTRGGHIVAIASVVDQNTGDAMTIDALHQSQAQLGGARAKGLVATAPVASPRRKTTAATLDFSWTPLRPIVGETVQFIDLSTGVNLAWSWSFGDGGRSNEQHPTHVYTEAGSYSVALSVTASGLGSSFVQKTVSVDAIPATAVRYLLAVVARLPGESGTRWRSDVWLLNPFATSQQVWLEYHPADGGVQRQRLVVRAGEQLWLDDVVGSQFADAGDSKGALHVLASRGIFVNSRTYNLGSGGTFGQAIPSLGSGDLLAAGDTGVLLKLKSTSTRRCNVGFTEFAGTAARVRVTLYNVAGATVTQLRTKTYDVGAHQNLQVNRVFADVGLTGEYESALAEVAVLSGGSIYAYASNVDSRTGDGEFIPAMVK